MPPFPPQGCVISTGNQQILLTWQQSLGATGYTVQRSTTGLVGSYTTISSPTTNTFLDTTVIPGLQYWYSVASVNVSGTSSYTYTGTNGLPLQAIPAQPGQVSLGWLKYMAKLRADKLTSQYLTDDEWGYNVNQSVKELYDIMVTKYGEDYFFAPPLLITLTGLNYYPLPDGVLYNGAVPCYKLNGVDLNVGGGIVGPNAQWLPMARFNWSDRDQWTFPGQVGPITQFMQMSYRVMGNIIHFRPANSNNSVRLWYIPVMTDLLQDTDMMPFSLSGWSELVIVDAAMKAMVKEESLEKWNALQASKAALIERIEDSAPNRDAGQPNSVSNTRSTLSDPGFGGSWGNWGGGFNGGGWGF